MEEKHKSFLPNKVYDTLKIVAAILPILGTFYYGLSEIWALPYGGPVQATFALAATTLSLILAKLSHDYTKFNQAIANNNIVQEALEDPEQDPAPDEPIEESNEEPVVGEENE